jgi:hypothetical protein
MKAMAVESSLLSGTVRAAETMTQLTKLCFTEANTSLAVMLMDVK